MMSDIKSKKEVIINTAILKPFTTLKELAKEAETTKRYVKNVLSDNSISLHNLRKEECDYLKRKNKELRKKIKELKEN